MLSDRQTLYDLYGDRKLADGVKSAIQDALKELNDGGFIFADLRRPNIMVVTGGDDGEVEGFIDFDWACQKDKGMRTRVIFLRYFAAVRERGIIMLPLFNILRLCSKSFDLVVHLLPSLFFVLVFTPTVFLYIYWAVLYQSSVAISYDCMNLQPYIVWLAAAIPPQ